MMNGAVCGDTFLFLLLGFVYMFVFIIFCHADCNSMEKGCFIARFFTRCFNSYLNINRTLQ